MNDGNAAYPSDANNLLKQQNAALEARILSLQKAYLSTLEEFKSYRTAYELVQLQSTPVTSLPPQMEFALNQEPQSLTNKDLLLPPLVDRLKNRVETTSPTCKAFNLRKVLERAVTSQERDAQKKGLDLALRVVPDTPVELAGDPLLIELLISNLLRFNTLATSDGFVPIEVYVEPSQSNQGELIVLLENNGCSRALHPWTHWVGNPHQAECHESELAADWCAQLIRRIGGRLDVIPDSTTMECRLILPVLIAQAEAPLCKPFAGECAVILYKNTQRAWITREQLTTWGLKVILADSPEDITEEAQVVILDKPMARTKEIRVLAKKSPNLPRLQGDTNRYNRLCKQLIAAFDYQRTPTEQPDLFA